MEKNVLILSVPCGVELSLYPTIDAGEPLSPAAVREGANGREYEFENLKTGLYSAIMIGEDTYFVQKALAVTAEKLAAGKPIAMDPGKRAGSGWEPLDRIAIWNDEVENTCLADPVFSGDDFEDFYCTPGFAPGKALHETYSQEEGNAFLRALAEKCPQMKLYSLGRTPGFGEEILMAVYSETDLSGVEDWREAAKILKKEQKPLVEYHAQIHGNEIAAGEGALQMCRALCGNLGKKYLPRMNIYVIPRLNPDGAHYYDRKNKAPGIDMNRDFLLVESREVELQHEVFLAFLPQVVIDGHEYRNLPPDADSYFEDLKIGPAGSLNNSEYLRRENLALVEDIFRAADEFGIRHYHYSKNLATSNNAIGRPWCGLWESFVILIETKGHGGGNSHLKRRTFAQFISARAILDYTARNAETILSEIGAARAALCEKGKKYDPETRIVLQHAASMKEESAVKATRTVFDPMTGEKTGEKSVTLYPFDTAKRSRSIPLAYLFPAGEAYSEKAAAVLEKNGVWYERLPAGTTLSLGQYVCIRDRAAVLADRTVTFPQGAIRVPTAQLACNVACLLMEPIVEDTDGFHGTLVQSGVLPKVNDRYPIYRQIREA